MRLILTDRVPGADGQGGGVDDPAEVGVQHLQQLPVPQTPHVQALPRT